MDMKKNWQIYCGKEKLMSDHGIDSYIYLYCCNYLFSGNPIALLNRRIHKKGCKRSPNVLS